MATPCARGCVSAAEAARAVSLAQSQRARRAASAAAHASPRTAHRAAQQPAVRTRSACGTVAMAAQHSAADVERPAPLANVNEARPGTRPLRLFAISDVHTDFEANMAWVESLSRSEYASDALIVAGDVSDDSAILAATLRAFKERFAEVFFTPGNHELWTERRASTAAVDSVAKLDDVLSLCEALGVHTRPALVGATPGATPLWVVPLLSWYHAEFDTEPSLEAIAVPPSYAIMTDFRACRWPPGVDPRRDDVARLMDARNEAAAALWPPELLSMLAQESRSRKHPVVTFSHFLPRLDLCPEKRFLFFPNLPQAVGSNFLGTRVDALRPNAHVFGHTHFACDTTLDGVRYVQAALAYPEERESRMGTLRIGSLAEKDALAPLLLYDSAGAGAWAPRYAARWSQYYDVTPREPHNQTLPPWVEKRYARRIAAAAATKAAAAEAARK